MTQQSLGEVATGDATRARRSLPALHGDVWPYVDENHERAEAIRERLVADLAALLASEGGDGGTGAALLRDAAAQRDVDWWLALEDGDAEDLRAALPASSATETVASERGAGNADLAAPIAGSSAESDESDAAIPRATTPAPEPDSRATPVREPAPVEEWAPLPPSVEEQPRLTVAPPVGGPVWLARQMRPMGGFALGVLALITIWYVAILLIAKTSPNPSPGGVPDAGPPLVSGFPSQPIARADVAGGDVSFAITADCPATATGCVPRARIIVTAPSGSSFARFDMPATATRPAGPGLRITHPDGTIREVSIRPEYIARGLGRPVVAVDDAIVFMPSFP